MSLEQTRLEKNFLEFHQENPHVWTRGRFLVPVESCRLSQVPVRDVGRRRMRQLRPLVMGQQPKLCRDRSCAAFRPTVRMFRGFEGRRCNSRAPVLA